MNKFGRHIPALLLFMLSTMMHGQSLPSLPMSQEITKGKLPNGMEYFLVTNTSQKGFADYTLVQTGADDAAAVRNAMNKLPHFPGRKANQFLATHGISYTPSGYIEDKDIASAVSLRDVPTYNQSAADSTLLMLFDMAAASRSPQAIVISGDINKDKIKERMGLLSMIVPTLDKSSGRDPYAWNPTDSIRVMTSSNRSSDVAAINVIFKSERTSQEFMNTAVPLVSAAYAHNLGAIVERRLKETFRTAGVPLADFRYRYVDAASVPDDEYYSFTVYTSARRLDEATRLLAFVLSSLDRNGATYDELKDAKDFSLITMPDNRMYTEKCIAAYLYGANLAPQDIVRSYTVARDLPDQSELGLFNEFASALLDPDNNITLRYDVPNGIFDREKILAGFNSAWNADVSYEVPPTSDLSGLPAPKGKIKLSKETAEPVSGGKLWTFSNGMRVIYKKTSSDGMFHYMLLLNGGFAGVPELGDGEGAFVKDMFQLGNVAGVPGHEFLTSLKTKGITMEGNVTLSYMTVSGTSPKKQFQLLMKSLLSAANDRIPDDEAYAYYRSGEILRMDMAALSPRDFNELADSVICPNNPYSSRRRPQGLGADLNRRAESYFATEFAKVNDGVLALFGDLDEETLKKDLCRMLSDFKVEKKASQRPRMNVSYATGEKTFELESTPGAIGGRERGVSLAMSAPVPFSLNSYMSFQIAMMMIRKQLAANMSGIGAYYEISHKAEVYPSERLTLYISSHPCRGYGLPDGIDPAAPEAILSALRAFRSDLEKTRVNATDLKAFKAALLAQYQEERNDPEKLMECVWVRYGEGKDIITGYKSAIEAVSADSVGNILNLLLGGATVEYIVN